jgi:hypothetical protein
MPPAWLWIAGGNPHLFMAPTFQHDALGKDRVCWSRQHPNIGEISQILVISSEVHFP